MNIDFKAVEAFRKAVELTKPMSKEGQLAAIQPGAGHAALRDIARLIEWSPDSGSIEIDSAPFHLLGCDIGYPYHYINTARKNKHSELAAHGLLADKYTQAKLKELSPSQHEASLLAFTLEEKKSLDGGGKLPTVVNHVGVVPEVYVPPTEEQKQHLTAFKQHFVTLQQSFFVQYDRLDAEIKKWAHTNASAVTKKVKEGVEQIDSLSLVPLTEWAIKHGYAAPDVISEYLTKHGASGATQWATLVASELLAGPELTKEVASKAETDGARTGWKSEAEKLTKILYEGIPKETRKDKTKKFIATLAHRHICGLAINSLERKQFKTRNAPTPTAEAIERYAMSWWKKKG